jgi:hypothetical protein
MRLTSVSEREKLFLILIQTKTNDMKLQTTLLAMLLIVGLGSCKKDRICECTTVSTDSSGNVTTDPEANATYLDMNMRDAKSVCQKSTTVRVNSQGGTSTFVSDCKLK